MDNKLEELTDWWERLTLWIDFKRFGLPYSDGWADHPAIVIETLRLFETLYNDEESNKRQTKEKPMDLSGLNVLEM